MHLMLKCNNACQLAERCLFSRISGAYDMVNRERRAGEGQMYDDLMGLLVADAGVDCAAPAMTAESISPFPHSASPAAVVSRFGAH
jgi:hypothetical protein